MAEKLTGSAIYSGATRDKRFSQAKKLPTDNSINNRIDNKSAPRSGSPLRLRGVDLGKHLLREVQRGVCRR